MSLLKHRVVGGRLWNLLHDILMLDDLAVFESEDVRDCHATISRFPDKMAVQHHQVTFRHLSLEFEPQRRKGLSKSMDEWRREIIVPPHFFNQRMVLRFGSVTHAAKVYINGQFVVEHKGGFTPFQAEINAFVSSGKNRLTVVVHNIVDHTILPVGNYQEEDVVGMGKVVTNTPNW